MVSAVVMIALLARVENKTEQVGLHKGLNVARATTDNNDVMLLQNILRSLAHISSEHNLYAKGFKVSGDTRLATATLG